MQESMQTFKSKKFVAYIVADIGWKFLMGVILYYYKNSIEHFALVALTTMIVTSGFVQIGYILGQAALDKYTALGVTALTKNKSDVSKEESKED